MKLLVSINENAKQYMSLFRRAEAQAAEEAAETNSAVTGDRIYAIAKELVADEPDLKKTGFLSFVDIQIKLNYGV